MKQQNLLGILLGSIIIFLFSILNVSTIISLSIILVVSIKLAKENWTNIQQRGLIEYTPSRIRYLLLNRSIYDLMCDVWFLQTISHVIKIIIAPVIYKLDPKEFNNYLKDNLEKNSYEMVTTKGLINLAPQKVRKIFVPQKKIENKMIKSISNTNLMHHHDIVHDLSTDSNDSFLQGKNLTKSNSSFKIFAMDKSKKNVKFENNEILPKTQSSKQKFQQDVKIQSQLLAQKLNKISEKIKSWDQSEFYKQLVIKRSQIKNQYQLKLQFINKLVQLKSINASYKVLIKTFVVGVLGLSCQLLVSQKTRKWVMSTISIIFYAISLLMTTSSLGLICHKTVQYFRNKSIKN